MIALLAVLLLALVPFPAAAQEAATQQTAAPEAATQEAATQQTAPEEKPAPVVSAQELFSSTLAQDIATASYYELVAWCQQLALDDSGSRQELMQRLAKHFGVALPEEKKAGKQTITLRSARESEYYTLADVNEKYVVFRGDVTLEVRNETDGSVQVIQADTLTFNQTRRIMSAEGNVSYALTRGGQTDTFTGQSLDFNLDTSEAVFYDGSTTRIVKRTGGDMPYSFKGQSMTRLENDTVILKNGRFTSSASPDDPLYQMNASTVWLLAPSEWAVQNGVLLIGRVPVLYIPGFFWPGDDFFFNPNIGYDSRKGSFVQTTTYLLGRKAKEDSPFSFLQLSDSGDSGYALEPHGLFLRKVPGEAAPKDNGHTVKLLLDAYSRLGVLAGVTGDFSPLATFRSGIGVSRSIFQYTGADGTLMYTPFLPTEAAGYTIGEEFWNSSSFFGLAVPFRFGLEGTFASSGDFYSTNADFQYFSDPSFTSDFYTRSESGILSNLFAQPSTATTATAQQSALSWDFTGKLDFTKMINVPFVQNLSLSNLNLKMTWLSSTPPGLTDPLESDPGSTFFYPSSITAPNVAFTASGDILKLGGAQTPSSTTASSAAAGSVPAGNAAPVGAAASTQAANESAAAPSTTSAAAPSTTSAAPEVVPPVKKAAAKDPGKGIRPPLPSMPTPTAPKAAPVRIPFRGPEPQSDVRTQQNNQGSSLDIAYQVQPRATLEHTFDTRNWTTQQNVDYTVRYRTLETGGTSSITSTASLWDQLLNTTLSLSADGLWRSRFSPSAAEIASSEWQSLLLRDLQQDALTLRSAFQSTLRPFSEITALSSSSLQYKLGVQLYQLGFTGTDTTNPVFTGTGPSWTTDAISEHSLLSTLALSTSPTTESLALGVQLPPLVTTFTGRLDVSGGVFKGSIQSGLSTPPTGILYQPLVVTGSLDSGSGLGAAEELQFDIANSLVSKSTSSVTLGGLSGSFVAQEVGTATTLLPSLLKIGFEAGGSPIWVWKDRISFNLSVKTHWSYNLQNYVDNLFDFNLNLTLSIFKFLDLTLSSVSNNSKTYRYVPSWAEAAGETWINPLTDLVDSFNVFNSADRIRSAFKINSFSIKAVQHFGDWDLNLQYQGSPQFRTDPADNKTKYIWTPSFSISVQWSVASELKSNITGDYTGVSLR